MDDRTMFGLMSLAKAFTATAAAMGIVLLASHEVEALLSALMNRAFDMALGGEVQDWSTMYRQ